MVSTRILIFTLFVSVTLFATAFARVTNRRDTYRRNRYESNKMLGKWYVVGLVTSSSVHEFQNCMISHVTKINDGFEIKTTTRLATGEIGPTFYSQAMDDNSPGLVQSHGKSVGLNKLLDYLTPDYSEIVIKYPDNTFKYFLLSRNPARISPGLYYKYYDIARANNWRYLQFNNRNCD